MNIFFDLDGTLLDSQKRVYLLFQHLIPASTFSFEEYWDLKRNKINHQKILAAHFNYSDNAIKLFEQNWMDLIEADEWLFLDRPLEGVTDLLKKLAVSNQLYIVTARQFKAKVFKQMDNFGWENVFKDVVVNEVPEKPGIYHLTFYEGFLKLVMRMRDKVEDGVVYAKLFRSRKGEKSYSSMAKKGGTSFTMHHDRAVATQTG